jgi:hypothetical protein
MAAKQVMSVTITFAANMKISLCLGFLKSAISMADWSVAYIASKTAKTAIIDVVTYSPKKPIANKTTVIMVIMMFFLLT